MQIRINPQKRRSKAMVAFRQDSLRRAISTVLAVVTVAAPWPAAGLERGKTPLELNISPTTSVVGGTVVISGRSVPLGDKKAIPIEIVGPDGTRWDSSARLSSDQTYTYSFSNTTATGKYAVTVFAADRRASSSASFTVQVPSSLRREATRRMAAAFAAIERGNEKFSDTIRRAPASVEREELTQRVDGLKELLADVDKALELLDQSMEALEEAIEDEDSDKDGSGGGSGSEAKPGTDPNLNPGDTAEKPQSVPEGGPTPGTDGAGETKPGTDPNLNPGDTAEKPQSVPEGAPTLPGSDGVGETKPGTDPNLNPGDTAEKPQSVPEGAPTPPGSDGVGETKPGTDPNLNPGDTAEKPQSVPEGAPTPPGSDGVGETKPGTDPNLNPGDTAEKPQSVPEDAPTPPGGDEPSSAPEGSSEPGSGGGAAAGGESEGASGSGAGGGSGGEGAGEAREELRQLHEEMGRAADEIEKQQESFEQQLQKLDYDHTLCDGLHYVQQAWDSMTAAMTAAKKLAKAAVSSAAKVAADLAKENAASAAAGAALGDLGGSSLPAEAARSQLASAAKAAATGSLSRFKVMENGIKGLVTFDIEIFFRIFCEKYVGPFEGKMTAEVFVDAGRFYAYETNIEGELRLRYEKGTAGAQPVTGEFEGVATSFKLDEDLWRIQPEIKRDTLLRMVFNPLPSYYAGGIGTFARVLLSPNYFYIPIRGVIEGDKARIRLEAARQDFDKSSTAAYVLANLSVPFPYVMVQEIDHEGGHYILTRALREDPELEVVVHSEEQYSEINESFQHDAATPDNMIKVRTEVEVRACNPKCP